MTHGATLAGGAVLLALATCSGGEGPDAVEPSARAALPTVTASVAPAL